MKKSKTILASLKRPVRSLIRRREKEKSQVLLKVLDSLAPRITKHPGLVRQIELYVFGLAEEEEEAFSRLEETEGKLKKAIQGVAGLQKKEQLDILWTTIEGMRLTAIEEGIEDKGELDNFMAEEKAAFKARLYGPGQSRQGQQDITFQDQVKGVGKS